MHLECGFLELADELRVVLSIACVVALESFGHVASDMLECNAAGFFSGFCSADSICNERHHGDSLALSQHRRIRKAGVINLNLFLGRADEEVILIVRADEATVSEPVDIELVVTRTTSNIRDNELAGIDHSSNVSPGNRVRQNSVGE